ncbi:antitoxin [Marinicella pacifica]|uniref:Antitoxin n=1 Tax=Marinicella pacifica TaxID=1171543 RepID=A0A917FSW8_9GAMM|nr:type II toxin-antitoxin system Phd/YefM family antitoxin [Marinicella pacifica]GGF98795.1 antitoxin [Marinicella pacifica]
MSRTTLSSREFNQDVSKAKRDSRNGPVFITDRGRASHVLLTIEEYQKLTGNKRSIVDLLAMPDAEAVEFNPPKLDKELFRPADLS